MCPHRFNAAQRAPSRHANCRVVKHRSVAMTNRQLGDPLLVPYAENGPHGNLLRARPARLKRT